MKQPELTTAAQFAQIISNEDVDLVVRTLSRRRAGREAILNSPTVVRAMAKERRQTKEDGRLLRCKQLAAIAAKASHAKGCATKMSAKMKKIEARNKGLRTQLSKVYV